MKTGDYGVVATGGFVAWAIRLITRSPVNHAFVYVGDGKIVEGSPGGALLSPVSKFPDAIWADYPLTEREGLDVARWAWHHVGTPYNWVDDAEIGVVDVFGWAPRFMRDRLKSTRTLMCSQLVDAAYQFAGVHLFDDGRPAGGVSPGDLYNLISARKAA